MFQRKVSDIQMQPVCHLVDDLSFLANNLCSLGLIGLSLNKSIYNNATFAFQFYQLLLVVLISCW